MGPKCSKNLQILNLRMFNSYICHSYAEFPNLLIIDTVLLISICWISKFANNRHSALISICWISAFATNRHSALISICWISAFGEKKSKFGHSAANQHMLNFASICWFSNSAYAEHSGWWKLRTPAQGRVARSKDRVAQYHWKSHFPYNNIKLIHSFEN